MEKILQVFIWLPLFAFFLSLLISKKNEPALAQIAIVSTGLQFFCIIMFTTVWILNDFPILDNKHMTLFKADDIEIFIDFYFDKLTAVFSTVGSFLILLVAVFSNSYLHREEGFKRYFNVLLLFTVGYYLLIFSGNFETLFIGWEIVGLTSFLLITFYRDRYLPVRNGIKVISIYRLSDICLILAMWMSHHLWHENIKFLELNDLKIVTEHLLEHHWYGVFISLMIVIAAAIKSAQIPFSTWLPRAMEGPTTSSAVFYGSLSVHVGAFLLLRTYRYWESLDVIIYLIILIGLITSTVATNIAKVQSSVKTQIAYSSIAQIGLIFIEIALGFHNLALIHFTGNAFLRTYQLLVAPSMVSYLLNDMVFNFEQKKSSRNFIFGKIQNTIYMLSLKEWNLDRLLMRYFWDPFKWVGTKLNFLSKSISIITVNILFVFGIFSDFFPNFISPVFFSILPFVFSILGLLLILKAFAERCDAIVAWLFVFGGQMHITLSILLLNENFGKNHLSFYFSGLITSTLTGYLCLRKIRNIDNNIQLSQFHGYIYEQPKVAFLFLLSCLASVGLPFTPTFIGIDLLFSHIHKHEEILIIFTAISFLFIELTIIRIYSRVFLGQYKKTYIPVAYRSS